MPQGYEFSVYQLISTKYSKFKPVKFYKLDELSKKLAVPGIHLIIIAFVSWDLEI